MSNEECRHGMNPTYCADCLGHKSADEEEDDIGREMVSNLLRFNSKKSEREV
jgi:hypothetical protein